MAIAYNPTPAAASNCLLRGFAVWFKTHSMIPDSFASLRLSPGFSCGGVLLQVSLGTGLEASAER